MRFPHPAVPFTFRSWTVLFVDRAVRLRPQTRLNWSDPRERASPVPLSFNTGFACDVSNQRANDRNHRATRALTLPRMIACFTGVRIFTIEVKKYQEYRRGYAKRNDKTRLHSA